MKLSRTTVNTNGKKPKKVYWYGNIGMRSAIEVKYATHLDQLKQAGEMIDVWSYEPIELDIAPNLKSMVYKNGRPMRTYTPDFVVERFYWEEKKPNEKFLRVKKEIHEVKGWGPYKEKGIARFENAANLYCNEYKFFLVQAKGGDFEITELV